MDQANLWTRRSNTKDKLSLPTRDPDTKDSGKLDSPRAFGGRSSHGKSNPFNTASPASAKSPGSTAFGLGTGAFASFGQAKTPKTPGTGGGFDFPSSKDKKEAESTKPQTQPVSGAKDDQSQHSLKNAWNIFYRPPTTSRDKDYEKSIIKVASVGTIEEFWTIYAHLKRPSQLPTVSDYHIFKDGIRPVWEDDANKKGGKWIIRLKKGVSDRYWEDLLLAIVGDQFMEASEEVCGAVLSVRSGEDVLSVWTANDGGRNIKIRETIKRVLAFPPDTNIVWRSHDESIEQKKAVEEARQQKGTTGPGAAQRRTSLYTDEAKGKTS
ncbi:hypothetical protein OHC33_005504 [Knufia fluminis]|uniref:Uncharacterized protein n=1 Tax=Knufia fluminis TaxID=191047 RepID=A0AAN8EGH6_9EURO|nr:hypothetical protein OHC33_005504 [Knufia fluminis]